MTIEEARAVLAAAKYVPGESSTAELSRAAKRVGTFHERTGDKEAAELRQRIKEACRVVEDHRREDLARMQRAATRQRMKDALAVEVGVKRPYTPAREKAVEE